MAAAVEREWPEVDVSGCVAVPDGYGCDCRKVRVRQAGHPVPDARSVAAAEEIVAAVSNLAPADLVLALISGGGSAAMCLPARGITLEDKQRTTRLLLASGLDIRTMNAVRRRLSAIKGGRLARAAAPARVVTFAISDIPGDEAEDIASGPTAPFMGGVDEVRHALDVIGPRLPARVRDLLLSSPEVVRAGNTDPIQVIASASNALAAAAQVAQAHGITPIVLGGAVAGEAIAVARDMAREAAATSGPCVLLAGGETTVTLGETGAGRGGRNTEFLLALVEALGGRSGVWALAADTDGEDGSNLGAAGAIAAPDTLDRARKAGLDPAAALAQHDSGSFFASLGDLIVTGPTLTNVNDFRAILVMPQQGSRAEAGGPA